MGLTGLVSLTTHQEDAWTTVVVGSVRGGRRRNDGLAGAYVTRDGSRTRSTLPVCQRLGQQRHQRLELDVGGGGDLLVRAVERARSQTGLGVDEFGDLGVNGLGGDDPPGGDGFGLPDPVDPVDGLGLLGVGP